MKKHNTWSEDYYGVSHYSVCGVKVIKGITKNNALICHGTVCDYGQFTEASIFSWISYKIILDEIFSGENHNENARKFIENRIGDYKNG